MKWVKYGDVHPIDHGGVFVQHDANRCYYVLEVLPYTDAEKWRIVDGYIDLDDHWINENGVRATCGTPEDAEDEALAADCMCYYGTELGNWYEIDREEDVVKFLHERGIEEIDG